MLGYVQTKLDNMICQSEEERMEDKNTKTSRLSMEKETRRDSLGVCGPVAVAQNIGPLTVSYSVVLTSVTGQSQ